MLKKIFIGALLFVLIAYFMNTDCFYDCWLPPIPTIDSNRVWSNRTNTSDDVRKIIIKVPETTLTSLRDKLKNRTISPSLTDSNFKYGFNSQYLEKVIEHWSTKYNWQNWEDKINAFPHYFTYISGLQIHYIHIRPILKPGQRSVPILLLHGWPGSFFEFYKVIPLLTDTPASESVAFEVICPSLPGFGWSDAADRPGMGISAMANIMFKLMERLNVTEKFYMQGGDFGAMIGATMTKMGPSKIAGFHSNMVELATEDLRYWTKVGLGAMLPEMLHFLTKEELQFVYPFSQKIGNLMSQMGYFWLQSTRPSTIGIALSDSPAGLAAYMLEKFGAWCNDLDHHLDSSNGGLEDCAISLEEMLTNVMVYFVTNSVSTSVRLYKEMWSAEDQAWRPHPVTLPVGLAIFPKEIIKVPQSLASLTYRDIRQFTHMARGGHFAALEEPQLLAEDVRRFVSALEAGHSQGS